MHLPSNVPSEPTANSYALQYQGLLDDYDLLLSYLRGTEKSKGTLANTLVKPSPFSALALDKQAVQTNGLVSITKMALYYGMTPWNPEDATEQRAAIHTVEEKRASHSLQLDRGVDIESVNRAPTAIDRETIDAYRAATPPNPITMEQLLFKRTNEYIHDIVDQFLPANEKSLITYLGATVLSSLDIKQIRATPTVCLEKVMTSERSRNLVNELLKGLDWYGGKLGEETSPGIRIKLLGRAIRVWAGRSREDKLSDIAGYPWHQRSNYGKSYQTIWADFEQHLLDTAQASSTTEAILLALLFRPEYPSDFRVSDVPSDLPYRSSTVWVNFAHGLNLAEVMVPDRVQHMTFQQFVDFPFDQSAAGSSSPEHLELIALTRIRPTVLWAITNGVLAARRDDDYSKQEIELAVSRLEKHNQEMAQVIIKLDATPPERLTIAKREILSFFGFNFYSSDVPKLANYDNYARSRDVPALKGKEFRISSFVDVYASGKLEHNEKWYLTLDGTTVTKRWVSLNEKRELQTGGGPDNHFYRRIVGRVLPDLDRVLNAEFHTYLISLRHAYRTLISSQLATLPVVDRQALEYGELRVYTLRKETKGQEADNETAEMLLPLRARKGFFLQAKHTGKTHYFELLPRAGIVRTLPDFDHELISGERKTEHWKISKNSSTRVEVLRHKTLPFDWDAHAKGTSPKANVTCQAIIDPLGQVFFASPATSDDDKIPDTLSSSRTHTLTTFICYELLFRDENAIKQEARGETEFDREEAQLKKILLIAKMFIPFWNSVEDIESGDKNRLIQGVFGLFTDLVSFAQPIGKFASGSLKLVSVAGKIGVRATLPSFTKLTTRFLVASLDNLNPLSIVPSLLKLGANAVLRLGKQGLKSFKFLTNTGHYDFTNGMSQVTNPGRYRALTDADTLASVKGIEDVPVRKVGDAALSDYRLVDPIFAKPYGPRLPNNADELSLGRSAYQPLENTDLHVTVELTEKATVREVLEVDGRTTLFIDDVAYQLDGDLLRRADRIDIKDRLKALPCRVRRHPNEVCKSSFVTRTPAPALPVDHFDETKGWALWFGDSIYTSANARASLKVDSFKNRTNLEAYMQSRKGIYGRVIIKVPEQRLDDTFEVGAIICESIDGSKQYVFTRLNAGDFYVVELAKGQSLRDALTFKQASTLPNDLKDELLTVYTGSLNANNMARIHGIEAVERAMKAMDEIAIPIGGHVNPPDTLKLIKVDTSPGEAALFDHSTRMIVRNSTDGAATWSLSKAAPDNVRQTTAEVFNALFKRTVVTLDSTQAGPKALKIDGTMRELQRLISRKRGTPVKDPRNIAFAEIKTNKGVREIYVSVSGNKGDTGYLPLFEKIADRKEVTVAGTRYFNIDSGPRFPKASLSVTPTGKLQAIPHTIDDIEKYTPALTSRPTSLDTEAKLISVIRNKYPDPKDLASITIATTMAPCDSCSVIMKQFGYDGSPDALNVLWK